MVWTVPRTWVTGEVITAALLNAQIRDNFLVASTHTHGGAAGDGSPTIGALQSEQFDFIGDPSAPGASKTIIYTKAGGLFYREGAAGAATQLSDENHAHTFAAEDPSFGTGITGTNDVGVNGAGHASHAGNHDSDVTITPTENAMIVAFASEVSDPNGIPVELFIDGVSQGSGASVEFDSVQGDRAVAAGALTLRARMVVASGGDHAVHVRGDSVIIT